MWAEFFLLHTEGEEIAKNCGNMLTRTGRRSYGHILSNPIH